VKYAVVLPDGASDEPLADLGGKTPLEKARIPFMDQVALQGRLGRVVTIPEGFTPGTDVGTLSLFGYDPRRFYPGRAPLEAAARGLRAARDEMVFRCNLVTVLDGVMRDNTGGHVHQDETDALIADLHAALAGEGCAFHAGVTYRNFLLLAGAADLEVRCAPPHDILDQPVAGYRPAGPGGPRVREIEDRAAAVLADHPVNRRRRAEGRPPVTGIWLWGHGRPRELPSFGTRFGCRTAVISAVDILRGLAVLAGMERIEVPGATGDLDTDYEAKGAAAVRALDSYDLVIVHVEAADEAAHMGRADEKVRALERIDEAVVGPLLERLRRFPEWRILVAADHPTLVRTRGHSAVPPLFAYVGTGVPSGRGLPFDDRSADASGDWVREGHRLMEVFLRT